MGRICNQYIIQESLDALETNNIYLINIVQKKIEKPYRTIPFSTEKKKSNFMDWKIKFK